MRKKDIVKLAEKHNKCMFYAFTNGTLIDEEFCKDMQRLGNISLALSVEGFEEVNAMHGISIICRSEMKQQQICF